MKSLKTLLARLFGHVIRVRLTIAQSDLQFLEARAPIALREQRVRVRALSRRLDRLEAGMCDPLPGHIHRPYTITTAEDVRRCAERNAKEVLL